MTTYTVYSPAHGTVYGENLTATQAAEIILTHDGHEFALRERKQSGFDLLVSRRSRNSQGGPCHMVQAWRSGRPIWSMEADPDKAWQDIAKQVITADWEGVPEALTTESYNAMRSVA